MHRKDYALELFRQQLAPRLLFSVGRFEIRRFSKMSLPVPLDLLKLAQEIPPVQRHYFVLFEGQNVQVQHVLPARFGTLTEITLLARWLDAHPVVRSLLIVSDASHLRRLRLCCRSLLDPLLDCAFVGVPDSYSSAGIEEESALRRTTADFVEVLKIFLYWPLLRLRRHTLLAARTGKGRFSPTSRDTETTVRQVAPREKD
jgi:hypothetical protein